MKTRQQILEEILEEFIIAVRKAEMEARARLQIDYYKMFHAKKEETAQEQFSSIVRKHLGSNTEQ
jgi:anaerobic ribonucleoside-triphosphate reductase